MRCDCVTQSSQSNSRLTTCKLTIYMPTIAEFCINNFELILTNFTIFYT